MIYRIKAVLFDCDGTLVNSEYAYYLGWRHAFLGLGRDLSLEDDFATFSGWSFLEHYLKSKKL